MGTLKKRISSYICLVSLIIGAVVFFAFDLWKVYHNSCQTLISLQQKCQTGKICTHNHRGELDLTDIARIYQKTEIINGIRVYHETGHSPYQTHVLLSRGSVPCRYYPNNGYQYKSHWGQKVVHTYLPNTEEGHNVFVDMLVDVFPLSVLRRMLATSLKVLLTLLGLTVVYTFFILYIRPKLKKSPASNAEPVVEPQWEINHMASNDLKNSTIDDKTDTYDVALPDLDSLLPKEESPLSNEPENVANLGMDDLLAAKDAGLENLNSFDDSTDEVFDSLFTTTTETYSQAFQAHSRFPEPPLLKSMVLHVPCVQIEPILPETVQEIPSVQQEQKPVLTFSAQEMSDISKEPEPAFGFSREELYTALEQSDEWMQYLSKILSADTEEDFSLLSFTLAHESGYDDAQKFFVQENNLPVQQFSPHSYGVCINRKNLNQAYHLAGKFVHFMENCHHQVAVGISSKETRNVQAVHLTREAFTALRRSVKQGGRIIGFRPNPVQYAQKFA